MRYKVSKYVNTYIEYDTILTLFTIQDITSFIDRIICNKQFTNDRLARAMATPEDNAMIG